jgi:hypothetical protein
VDCSLVTCSGGEDTHCSNWNSHCTYCPALTGETRPCMAHSTRPDRCPNPRLGCNWKNGSEENCRDLKPSFTKRLKAARDSLIYILRRTFTYYFCKKFENTFFESLNLNLSIQWHQSKQSSFLRGGIIIVWPMTAALRVETPAVIALKGHSVMPKTEKVKAASC